MLEMVYRDIFPAVSAYCAELSTAAMSRRAFVPETACSFEEDTVSRLSVLLQEAYRVAGEMQAVLEKTAAIGDIQELAMFYKDSVLSRMEELRAYVDEMETLTAASAWPMPTYGDLLLSVN